MIHSVSSASPNISVSSPVSPYVSESGPLRWNGSSQQIEVMTQFGYTPLTLSHSGVVIQCGTIDSVVSWAQQKMLEEARLEQLINEHPGLKDAKEKYEIMLALVRKEAGNGDPVR